MTNLWFWILSGITLFILFFFLLLFVEYEENSKEEEDSESSDEYQDKVSIVIPAYNEESVLARAIESCLGLDYPSFEIIVVDDGSTDGTGAVAEEYAEKERVKYIRHPENEGKGAALNTGIKQAEGRYVACLDADSFVDSKALKKMVDCFGTEVGAVTPAMKVNQPTNLLQKVQWLEYILGILFRKLLSTIDSIYVTPGPFSLYRRQAVEAVGGFDNESIVEDQEMCYRLQERHWKVRSSLSAEVFTDAPSSLREFYHQRNRWYKGGLLNLVKYRKIIFNKDYGEFGFFMLPVNLIQAALSVAVILMVFNYAVMPMVDFIRGLSAYSFDIFPIISNLMSMSFSELSTSVYWSFLSWNFKKIVLLLLMFLLTLFALLISHKKTEERVRDYGVLPVITFTVAYFVLIGAVWIGVFLDLAVGRMQRW